MKVDILAFGVAKDIFGSASVVLDLPEGASIAQLRSVLEDTYPRLKELSSYMIAQNESYAEDHEPLLKNSEVAVIPPVSGG